MLYVQEDVAEGVLHMLEGAMQELKVGDPWLLSTDVGPVIDAQARDRIEAHCAKLTGEGRLIKRLKSPGEGLFVPPSVFRLSGIEELEEEIFGPVLHVATFQAEEIDAVVDAVNARGYGLTFGLHTRVDDRVERIVDRVKVGNVYVNRNQIGAVVGSQPFGGEGLSGTGPKAGGPHYVMRFVRTGAAAGSSVDEGMVIDAKALQGAIDGLDAEAWGWADDRRERLAPALTVFDPALVETLVFDEAAHELPGPTGEQNRLTVHPRGVVLCLGPDAQAAKEQALQALAAGNGAVIVAAMAVEAARVFKDTGAPVAPLGGTFEASSLMEANGFHAVACSGGEDRLRALRQALAQRDGMLVPLITEVRAPERYSLERHVCVDTTAAGGNASLLAAAAE
jgi:RHH-type proline utilization regulon transcriptional repressor/proline dehydrogenase/delta 1-pyrroline-5-carboxylate dehydrogenase